MTRRGWPLSTQIVSIAAAICAIALSGCTKLARNLASSSNTSYDDYTGGDYNSGTFVLSQVLASQQSAGTMYDLIGQGNQFDAYCSDATACMCEFTYVQGGTTQTAQVAPSYQESNLLRCSNQVPSGISIFDVRIVTTDGVSYSNAISVNLNNGNFAGSTLFLDLTNTESFVQAKRFQCRKHEFILNPLDGAIIDPFQSDDPKVIYPFNFYTTNVSESALQMQRLGNQNWECTLTETQDRSLHWWANAHVFSSAPCTDSFCSGDGELMYPNTQLVSGKIPVSNPASVGKRRGSFWLARQAYGVFQIPLSAAIAPKDYVSSTYGVIGYAAKPIPSTSGSSSCPAITLPSKATWVKLWNFRATDITPAKKVTASQSSTTTAIACNPEAIGPFPTCTKNRTDGGLMFGTGLTTATNGGTLASRIALMDGSAGNANTCYNVDQTSWTPGTMVGGTWYQKGPENWEPSPVGFGDPAATGSLTIAQAKGLPWGLYGTIAGACVGGDTVWRYSTNSSAACPAIAAPPAATPADNQVTAEPLSIDNYTDQLFVVTDPSVDDSQMRNQGPSSSQYRPVTYRARGDCPGTSRGNCPANKELHWDVNVKEVGNSSSADIYPLCVLQFYD